MKRSHPFGQEQHLIQGFRTSRFPVWTKEYFKPELSALSYPQIGKMYKEGQLRRRLVARSELTHSSLARIFQNLNFVTGLKRSDSTSYAWARIDLGMSSKPRSKVFIWSESTSYAWAESDLRTSSGPREKVLDWSESSSYAWAQIDEWVTDFSRTHFRNRTQFTHWKRCSVVPKKTAVHRASHSYRGMTAAVSMNGRIWIQG